MRCAPAPKRVLARAQTTQSLIVLFLHMISHTHTQAAIGRSLTLEADARATGGLTATTTTRAPTTTLAEPPDFVEPIGNLSVAVGKDAQFECKINNLANFRTAWLRVEDKGILTIHNNVITRNYRLGLLHDDTDTKPSKFALTIKNVQPSDRGGYMCQINSVPMKFAIGYLDVLSAPAFDSDEQSSGESSHSAGNSSVVTVVEGSNANLSCKASGHPEPQLTWRREDNKPILLTGAPLGEDPKQIDGQTLRFAPASRLNSGAYLCIASNGVQPSASKRQVLDVHFSPVVRIPQKRVGAVLGQRDVRLVCHVDMNPAGTHYWYRDAADELLVSGDKYDIVIQNAHVHSERAQMTLTIRNVERADFGTYKCTGVNALGAQSNTIQLYESIPFSLETSKRLASRDPTSTWLRSQPPSAASHAASPLRAHSKLTAGLAAALLIMLSWMTHYHQTPTNHLRVAV